MFDDDLIPEKAEIPSRETFNYTFYYILKAIAKKFRIYYLELIILNNSYNSICHSFEYKNLRVFPVVRRGINFYRLAND